MPSPLGHALGGIAAGGIAAGARLRRDVWLLAALGMLADCDLLFGAHSGPTHSIGAAFVVALAVFVVARIRRSPAATRVAAAAFLAYGSHPLLDWLGNDSSPPLGIMALWPFSREHYESSLHVFMATSRRYWQGEAFWRQNLAAVAREIAILAPAAIAVWWMSMRTTRSGAARTASPP
jgi:LexA-binding, inner membrane-associated putative hydrolase